MNELISTDYDELLEFNRAIRQAFIRFPEVKKLHEESISSLQDLNIINPT